MKQKSGKQNQSKSFQRTFSRSQRQHLLCTLIGSLNQVSVCCYWPQQRLWLLLAKVPLVAIAWSRFEVDSRKKSKFILSLTLKLNHDFPRAKITNYHVIYTEKKRKQELQIKHRQNELTFEKMIRMSNQGFFIPVRQ